MHVNLWIKSLVIVFSMYSKIPMPHLELEEKDMRYVMGFFPLVGVVTGGVCEIWRRAASYFALPDAAAALVFITLPVFITGGIHLDGYMDTCDALHSYGNRQKKLEILKDAHIGAFAVIMLFVYFAVCYAAGLVLLDKENEGILRLLGLQFVLSRIITGFAAVNFYPAKKNGMLRTVTGAADKRKVNVMLAAEFVICAAVMCAVQLYAAVMLTAAVLVWLFLFRRMAYREIGGITGDLAGYLLCLSELCAAVVLAFCAAVF